MEEKKLISDKWGNLVEKVFLYLKEGIWGRGGNKEVVRCLYCNREIVKSVYISYLYDFHGIDVAEKYGYKKLGGDI